MLFALFTQTANTYDDVIKDLDLQSCDSGKSARIGDYKIIKGYVNMFGTEKAVAMINDNEVLDISRYLGRPVVYNPHCTEYGFKPTAFEGVVIILG
jgi:hypothetical protein